ncbi:MAG: patatin-like phospholipase family protein [Ginsengibacter sp.]
MKALVISGGGSKGAFAGGIAEHLINDCGNSYDLLVGSSAGSLLLPHVALGNIEKIKKIFTTVKQEDVFNVSPFSTKETNGSYFKSINQFAILRNILRGHVTFGESENLRNLIFKSLTKKEFEEISLLHKKVIVTVSNLTKQKVEYFNTADSNYEDFCNWTWASANAVPYMSVYEHNSCQYADGGFGNHIPINCALENGVTDLDVIILEGENEIHSLPLARNPFSLVMETISFMSSQISMKDRIIGRLMGLNRELDIRMYFTPKHLTNNPFVFRPELMSQWWEEGLAFARNNEPVTYSHRPNAKSDGQAAVN